MDAGEIKARASIEYDGSGADKMKSDVQELAQLTGGSLADGASKGSEGLAQLEEQAGKTSDSVAQLSESASSLEKPFSNAVGQITSVSEALGEHQGLIESTGKAYEALQGPIGDTAVMLGAVSDPMLEIAKNAESMQSQIEDLGGGFNVVEGSLSNVVPLLPQFADNLHAVNDSFATQDLGKYTDNISTFQDAMSNPSPFSMIQQHLEDTGQTWDDFTSSIGDSNVAILHDMASNADVTHTVLSDMSSQITSTGQVFSKGVDETAAYTAQYSAMGDTVKQANDTLGGFNDTLVATNKGLNEYGVAGGMIGPMAPASMMGGGGEALGLGEILGSAGTGALDMMNTIAMPLMAAQQIGMVIGTVSTGMYNMAAVAEGPAAHSLGSFTGTVDALGQASQKTASAFSEGFGQGVLPTLNALNAQTSGGTDFFSMSGKWLGTNLSALGDFLEMSSGINAVGGFQGLVNTGASMLGMQQPFMGPGPASGDAANYAQIQTQIAQIPISLAVSTATMQAQATSPAYLAAQAYLGSQTAGAQLGQTIYSAGHLTGMSAFDYTPQSYQLAMSGQIASMPYAQQGISSTDINRAFFNSLPGGPDVPNGWSGPSSSDSQNATFGGSFGQSMQNIGSNIGNWWSNLFGGGGQQPTSDVQATWAGQGGCFPAGTQVIMADARTTKPIEALHIGDSVLAHNGIQHVSTTVLARIVPLPKRVYKLTFLNGNSLTLTDSHPISTEQGWKSLSPRATKKENPDLAVTTLLPGDIVHTVDGVCTLISIEPGDVVQIFNITVGDPHTFYADGILVHNKTGANIMSQVADTTIPTTDLSRSNLITSLASNFTSANLTHTFTADVQWAATGLSQAYTAVASWNASGLLQNFMAQAQWAASGLAQNFMATASWAEQGLVHAATVAASWTENNLIKPVIAEAQWAEQGLVHAATAAASWTEEHLINPVVAAATWTENNVIHPVVASAEWEGQNLLHQFVGIATWVAQGLNAVFSPSNSTPSFASGVDNYAGGYAMVGEAGPELVYLPQGSSVYPQVAGGGFQGLNNQLANNNQNQQPQLLHQQIMLDSRVLAEQTIPLMAPMLRQLGRRTG